MTEGVTDIPVDIVPPGGTEQQTLRPITPDTKEWEPGLELALPIDTADIPDFAGWVNWNDFNIDPSVRFVHRGHDFAAYYTTDGNIIFGLPKGLPIHAIANGTVTSARTNEDRMAYYSEVEIEHGHSDAMPTDNNGLISSYIHVLPSEKLKSGDAVKKGDIIGHLYAQDAPQAEGNALVHLHLELLNRDSWNFGNPRSVERLANPTKIFPHLLDHSVPINQQGRSVFTVPSLPERQISNAHGFQKIVVNNGPSKR